MTPAPSDSAAREEHLQAVLLDYIEAVEAGRAPDRQELLAAHPDLRAELEAFFAGHDEVERLAAPLRARHAGAGELPTEKTEHVSGASSRQAGLGELGDFRLLREIGRGGMGVVYEAEQISLRRRVALKVLPFAAAIDPRRLLRFKNEALAAAQLRHESIVSVHAVGSERGVHYYAMQYIEGQSLAALIAELRRPAAEGDRVTRWQGEKVKEEPAPSATLSPCHPVTLSLSRDRSRNPRTYFEWVARVGRQAAEALEHAHQAGVVHRDVKPDNLLLDARGELWVTDFGLAQVTGESGLTMTGELLGTLRYASPEQALGRHGVVDHRSDVYSLGATLYELLTLRPVFDGRDRNELLRQIADDEPVPPRSLVPGVALELQTIVLKALRKESADRYPSAHELADDLGRFLNNQPIRARPPSLADHLRRWARRHPGMIAACAVVLLLLTAGSLLSAVLIRHEQGKTRTEQRRAEEAYERERLRAEEAETRFQLAQRSITELIQVSEEELADRPGMEGVRKRLLGSALAFYQELVEQRRDNPGAQAELRDTTRRVKKILADLAVLRAGSRLYLLCQAAVLDDLKLDAGQRAKMKDVTARGAKWWVETLHDIGRLSAAERGQRALAHARANEADVSSILTPAQQARLRQIGVQSEGAGAFRDPEVVAVLRLSPRQREAIRALEEETVLAWRRAVWRGAAGEEAATRKAREVNERILALLTGEQRRLWSDTVGPPIQGSLTPFAGAITPSPPRARKESPR
jgi:serine/threonine protein kinase